jgi:hypothetical protein
MLPSERAVRRAFIFPLSFFCSPLHFCGSLHLFDAFLLLWDGPVGAVRGEVRVCIDSNDCCCYLFNFGGIPQHSPLGGSIISTACRGAGLLDGLDDGRAVVAAPNIESKVVLWCGLLDGGTL